MMKNIGPILSDFLVKNINLSNSKSTVPDGWKSGKLLRIGPFFVNEHKKLVWLQQLEVSDSASKLLWTTIRSLSNFRNKTQHGLNIAAVSLHDARKSAAELNRHYVEHCRTVKNDTAISIPSALPHPDT